MVGERFLVRNSGATAVVEGVGDHALEYMTGGTALILGRTGRNIAAGMSGGVAYVYKLRADLINSSALLDGEVDLLELSDADKHTVKSLLEKHQVETGSKLAQRLLESFDAEVALFTKILPRDYAKVLEIQATAVAAGEDLDSAVVWNRILEVNARG
jgi:glutamate synthase (NADPH/NADH) large chain